MGGGSFGTPSLVWGEEGLSVEFVSLDLQRFLGFYARNLSSLTYCKNENHQDDLLLSHQLQDPGVCFEVSDLPYGTGHLVP